MSEKSRLNNPESCICCARRTDGLAVGKPGKLAWYCQDCGPDLARVALAMKQRDFDSLEKLAAEKVADAAGGDVNVPAAELPAFIAWAVKEFADTMRKHLESGEAPF